MANLNVITMLTALGKFILAKRIVTRKTKEGFIIPSDAAASFKRAEVVSVGDKVTNVKTGDNLVVTQYTSMIEYEGDTYFVLKDDEVSVVEK